MRECHPTSGLGPGCLRPDVEEVRDSTKNRHRERESGEPQRPGCAARASIARNSNDCERRQGQDGRKHRKKKVIRDAFGRDRVERRPEKERS